jgi:phosphonate transport system substrate-binding protein
LSSNKLIKKEKEMKNYNVRKFVVACVCAVSMVMVPFAGSAFAEIKFGILPRLSAVELTNMFSPLAEYLSKETGEKVSLVIPKDFDSFQELVKSGKVDMGFSNPLIYIQLKKGVNVEPLAVSAEAKAGTKFRGIIISRKDSGIEKIQDLKGKKLIFVEEDSAAGYIFQMLLLSKAGMDVNKDFIRLPFAKKHDNVVMAVFNKAADAGGIREDDLDKMKDKVDISQIKIVGYSDYFPNWPVYATPKLNKDAAAKIHAALLKLKPKETESEKILGAAKLTGFVNITDKDYDQLRQAAKLVGAF